MKARFRVTFTDGSVEELEAEGADQAKTEAKNRRFREIDPGGGMNVADRRSHGRTQVRTVEELKADEGRDDAGGRRDEREVETRDERERREQRERDERERSGRTGGHRGDYVGVILVAALALAGYLLERLLVESTGGVLSAGVLMLVSARGTAITATISALAAVTGDSLAVPHFPDTKKAWLLQVWADVQVAGTLRIRSPKMHDNVNGIRIDTIISDPAPMLPWGARQQLYSGDTLIVELAGSAVAGDEEFVCMLQYFEELSAQHSKLLPADQVLSRLRDTVTVENTITTVATGVYGGAEAINAEIDQFQHNDEYAILGYKVDTECAAIRYRAPDFANVGVGGPGIETEPELTADWFLRLSRAHNLPLVPTFNAANKASVLIDALQDENGADTTVTTFLGRLARA